MGVGRFMAAISGNKEDWEKLLEDCVTNTAKVFALLELARMCFDEGKKKEAKKYLEMAAQAANTVYAYCGGDFFIDISNKLSEVKDKKEFDEELEKLIIKHFGEEE